MIKIIPAILSKTQEEFDEKITALIGLVDWVQIDITDDSYWRLKVPFKVEAHILTKNLVDTGTADRVIIHQGEISWANKDYALALAVEPGEAGGEFNLEILDVIKNLGAEHPFIDIAIDGGINPRTAKLAIEAGANILVAGSYLFKDKKLKENLNELQNCDFRSR